MNSKLLNAFLSLQSSGRIDDFAVGEPSRLVIAYVASCVAQLEAERFLNEYVQLAEMSGATLAALYQPLRRFSVEDLVQMAGMGGATHESKVNLWLVVERSVDCQIELVKRSTYGQGAIHRRHALEALLRSLDQDLHFVLLKVLEETVLLKFDATPSRVLADEILERVCSFKDNYGTMDLSRSRIAAVLLGSGTIVI